MGSRVELNTWDLAIFAVYLVVTLVIGFAVARRGTRTVAGYFLGGRDIPWYVVGTSLVATVISSEHFIGTVGAAYATWIVDTLLIWVFLPYYMRTGLYTMPEFLERRYNAALRYLYTVFLAVGYVAS